MVARDAFLPESKGFPITQSIFAKLERDCYRTLTSEPLCSGVVVFADNFAGCPTRKKSPCRQ
jgi:hypothetical protein